MYISVTQGASLGDSMFAVAYPIEQVTMGGLSLFDVGIRNGRECCERQSLCPTWELNQGPQFKAQYAILHPLYNTDNRSIINQSVNQSISQSVNQS